MKIAIDIAPVSAASLSEHKVRGVGRYINLLRNNLEKYDTNNSYVFTSEPQKLKEEVDIIHYPYFDPFFITLPLKSKIPFIVTVHDIIPIAHKSYFPVGVKGKLKWTLNKQLLKNARAIITDSEASKNEIGKFVGFDEKKIFSAYLSVDEEFETLSNNRLIDEIKAKYKLPDKFILYVGDVTWNKNLPRLVKKIAELGYPLVMVGKALSDNDYDKKNLWNKDRAIVESLTKNNTNFIKLGFVPNKDLVGLYNLAHFLCMPSLDEGFGLPVLEAMKCGCPVLISKEGSLPEVGGNAAIYLDARDETNIATNIVALMKDNDLRNKWSEKISKQAEKFSLRKFIEDTVKVYEIFKS